MIFPNNNKNEKRFVVLGNSRLTKVFIIEIKKRFCLSGVISTSPKKRQLSSMDLRKFCREKKIRYLTCDNLNTVKGNRLLKKLRADYIVSTWPFILTKKTINIPKNLFIGTHPTELPFNRGRHPLHWLICLGIKKSKMSFFKMDSGIDHGPILKQTKFNVHPDKCIAKTEEKMIESAKKGLRKLLVEIKNGSIQSKNQNHIKSNYWRKRTIHDVILDPRMDHKEILRTVNSFSKPYPGAVLIFNKQIFRVKKARLLPSPSRLLQMEYGRIHNVKGNIVALRMGNRLIELRLNKKISSSGSNNNYVFPPTYYLNKNLIKELQWQ